ncbi:Putative Flp pilus-assembly TadE/G-like [Sanguibacter gelidistatuariae]|uniref:Putative Flp pilus-assembly TadE/G-like n=1 Tax=Sanguibacter gelidistatuariae TaxID=1814289 RepID=A0A1G6T111_9MICO|nr:Putative Flp pilus-assembly TadE/G-like [Sanguibacter gelidistatuariae]
MTGQRRSRVQWRDETGSVSVFVAITAIGLMILAGLIADGGAKLRATQRAESIAAEAARAGGQAIDTRAIAHGRDLSIDVEQAVRAAQTYLTSAGVEGAVSVSDDGTRIQVHVTSQSRTVFLSLIGIGTLSANGNAAAVLVHSTTGQGP